MKRSWFPLILIVGLLGLLVLLAALQYKWLGQISDGERDRMKALLQSNTQHFAEDFNREIQNAYFNFQLNSEVLRGNKTQEFNERFRFWKEKTAYPDLIENFYLFETASGNVLRYDKENGKFFPADLPEKLNSLKEKLADEKKFVPLVLEIPALLMPVNEPQSINRIVLKKSESKPQIVSTLEMPKREGILIIELNDSIVKNKILPDLAKKYFSESDTANYKIAVVNPSNETVFQTAELTATDVNAKLFDLSPDNFIFFSNKEILSSLDAGKRKNVVINKVESNSQTFTTEVRKNAPIEMKNSNNRVEMKVITSDKIGELPKHETRIRSFEASSLANVQNWTLNVQHTAGSLEQFITNTRQKNLAVSFGILSLLGVSVVLIFLSSQRAKLLAQRQLDFVSSVSHEFRTPLAVIYSAGENLADGVAKEETQVSRYGNLIKGEGKKLSTMVEQILEFAGARSGKRKFDFQTVDVRKIIENAVAECQPLIEEKGFTTETEIAENLPPINADKTALTQVMQNLIANSIKYSNGKKYLKVTAKNGDGTVKISVQDKGIGIERQDLSKIFEPFYRAKSVVDAQIHGNGLGLSLVKQIVEAHGGKISVESKIGEGSIFTVELKS